MSTQTLPAIPNSKFNRDLSPLSPYPPRIGNPGLTNGPNSPEGDSSVDSGVRFTGLRTHSPDFESGARLVEFGIAETLPHPTPIPLKPLLFCTILLLSFALYKDLPNPFTSAAQTAPCKGNSLSQPLSPQQLKNLQKTIPGTPKTALSLPTAYCTMPTVVVRAGTIASREVYRINPADSPTGKSSFGIAMYESNRFAGFRILTE